MLSNAELERRINNICQIGTISEVYTTQRPKDHSDYALFARVDIMGRTTDFFPVMTQMGSFKRHYCPPQVGEQVIVLCPFGNANVGYILRGVFSHDKEPITHSPKDKRTEYMEYEDGTKIEISLHDKKIKIATPMDVEIKTTGAIELECSKPFILKSPNAKIDKSGNLNVTGEMTDTLGNITKHKHAVKEHSVAVPRS